MKNKILLDVIPFSLGVRVKNGLTSILINKNSQIPYKTTKVFETAHDNQDHVHFKIYEGERPIAEDNHLLGKFKITNVKKAP